MKTILSAHLANPDGAAIILHTQEASAVAIQLPPLPDVSGGWRDVYDQWLTEGHTPTPFPLSED